MLGEIVWELAPGKGNPRNSEGAFLPLGQGERLLFCYSSFLGDSARDHTPADIVSMRSLDGGATWSEPQTLLRAATLGAMNLMSLSLLRMGNGDIGLFFLNRQSWQDMRVMLIRSTDEGRTWGEPVYCSPRVGYFVVNNDRAALLSSGRIVIPAAEHVATVGADGEATISPAVTTFFCSDDDGHTWFEARHVALPQGLSRSGLQEPGVIELRDGSLLGWSRTDLGCQYVFTSRDGGLSWSEPTASRFTSPLSPMSIKRLPDGALLAVWNPNQRQKDAPHDGQTLGRTPLVFALSRDEGETWSAPRAIEDDPCSGYCYTAIQTAGEWLLLAYCAGHAPADGCCLNRLRIRRIRLSELENELRGAIAIDERSAFG